MAIKLNTISSKDGLPNEQVHAISEDEKGRLWLAGPAGAMCYNGKEIRSFDTRDGLECPGLRTIKVREQHVWIGTDRGIERLHIDGVVHPLSLNFDWIYGIAECFLFTNDRIYVGTSDGLLILKETEAGVDLIERKDLGLVTQLLKFGDKILTICSKFGLVNSNGNQNQKFSKKLSDKNAQKIHLTIDGVLLVGTNNGLFALNEEGEILADFSNSEGNNSVNAISSAGPEVFVAFGNIFFILVRSLSKFEIFSESVELKSRIKDFHIDAYNNIWIATNNSGLTKIAGLNKVIYPLINGSTEATFSIKKAKKDEIICGGAGSFHRLSLTKGEKNRIQDTFYLDTIIWDLCYSQEKPELLWLATEAGLYLKEERKEVRLAFEDNNIIRGPNRCLLARGDKMYIGTISGLYEISSNYECKEILNENGISFGYVYSMSLSDKNEIWVATLGQGLWKESNEVFRQINDENISEKGNTYSVHTNELGKTIVVQQENILLIDQNLNSQILVKEYPLGGWTSCWIDNFTVAVGSSDGICIIDTKTKQITKRINLFLDRSEWQFTSSRALIYDKEQNKLFAGLNSGIFEISLDGIEKFIIAPVVHLNQITWKNAEAFKKENQFEIQAGRWSGQLQVYSTWFVDETTLQYRFKIIGFEEEWSELSPINVLHFNSLPPGEYEVQAQAHTPLSGFGEPKSLVRIKVNKEKIGAIGQVKDILRGFSKNQNEQKQKTEQLTRQNQLFQQEIEDRKKVENELKNYKGQLEALINKRTQELYLEKERAVSADKLKTVFLATMSHEIRTPLGGIIGLNNLLKDTELTSSQEEYISKIDYSAQHLLQIINDILDITKIESGSLQLENTEFSIHKLIEELAELVTLKMDKELNFLVDKDIENNHFLFGDPLRIKQVLINLLGNAIKFTEKGSVSLKIKQLNDANNKVSFLFSVIDSGIGMTSEQQEHLFTPFKQGDRSTTRVYGGTGLGLNISEKFVNLMDSQIKVNSAINEGSEFAFALSLEKSEKIDPFAFKDQFTFNTDNKKLLLFDQLNESAALIQKIIEKNQLEIETIDDLSQIELIGHDAVIINLSTSHEKQSLFRFLSSEEVQKIRHKLFVIYDINQFDSNRISNITDFRCNAPVLQSKIIKVLSDLFNGEESKIKKINQTESADKTYAVQNKHILVAEDNPINQMIIKKVLVKYGFEVTIANNGAECVEELKKTNSFELVLMDIQMPELDGIQATKIIREELGLIDLPIVALTADVTVETKSKVKVHGMNDFLSKPLIIPELEKIINHWIKA